MTWRIHIQTYIVSSHLLETEKDIKCKNTMAFLFFTNKSQPVYIDFWKKESTVINYSRHHFSLSVSAIVSVFILATLQFMLPITLQEKQYIESSENQQNNGPF